MTVELASPVQRFVYELRPRQIRTFRQFAEDELVLPNGPRQGLHFRCDFMAWTGPVLDEFTAGRYNRFFASGPTQAGKTLLFFIIPTLYHLFERRDPVIIGVPKLDMAQAIYAERLLPVITQTRYAEFLPRSGAGSRGGKFEAVRFENGAILRFMGAGGGDEQRSSHTAPIVILTEIDKMDTSGPVSREGDPVRQIEARNRSFRRWGTHRVYAECTMSIETGRVYHEVVENGTDTRVYLPCAHCGEYITPEREHFGGWQGAANVIEARKLGRFACPECGAEWREKDRRESLQKPVLAAKGQTVTRAGHVHGKPPATKTFGFRWNAMHSALTEMADIAEDEWQAEQTDDPSAQKVLTQFVWALPYKDELMSMSGLTRDFILTKITQHPRGVAPDGTAKLTVFVDLGLYRCWWATWAWKDTAEGYVIDYGAIEVPQGRQTNPLAILSSLRAWRDDVLVPGWKHGESVITHDLCLVDSGYQPDIAYTFVKESGQGRYFAAKGLGTARNQTGWRAPKAGKDCQVGHDWFISRQPAGVRLVNMHSDHWKRAVHDGFSAPPGAAGSLSLYHAAPLDHVQFARQITAEREDEGFQPGVGTTRWWTVIRKDNHYLDCTYGCHVAADMLGIRLVKDPKPPMKTAGQPARRTRSRDTAWKIGR